MIDPGRAVRAFGGPFGATYVFVKGRVFLLALPKLGGSLARLALPEEITKKSPGGAGSAVDFGETAPPGLSSILDCHPRSAYDH